ncbi:MAG: hypothetical protein DRI32_01960 [Chloroflexi bacterium]|nr:MAG: hypothetical protein DRI32_01960 [Chloroflexota bacterium]
MFFAQKPVDKSFFEHGFYGTYGEDTLKLRREIRVFLRVLSALRVQKKQHKFVKQFFLSK